MQHEIKSIHTNLRRKKKKKMLVRYYQQRMLSLTVYTWNGWISMNKSPFKSSDCHGRPGQLPTSRSHLKIAKIRWAWRIQKKNMSQWMWFFVAYYLLCLMIFSGLLSPVVAIPPQIWSNDDHLQAWRDILDDDGTILLYMGVHMYK